MARLRFFSKANVSPGNGGARSRHKRVLAIAAIFVVAQFCIVVLGVAGANGIDVLRAYSSGGAEWVRAQKGAVINLFRYAETRNPADYRAYEDTMKVLKGDHLARITLQSDHPDYDLAARGLIAGRNAVPDVNALMWGFHLFRHWGPFELALDDWARADAQMAFIETIGARMHADVIAGAPREKLLFHLSQISGLNRHLSESSTDFIADMGRASRKARNLVFVLFGAFSTLICIIGGALAWYIARIGARAEARAEESEARIRDFAEIGGDWFCEMDRDFRVVYMSERLPDSGIDTTTGIVGRHWATLGDEFGFVALTGDHLETVAAHRTFRDHRFKQTSPEGRVRYWSFCGKPVFDADGAFNGYRTTGTEITKAVQVQESLAHAKDEAVRANKAKSAFLANMSHELRTPLNAILGFSEIIEGEVLGQIGNARYRDYAHDIRDSGQHLLAIINDVLELSRIEAGRLELREERMDVAATIAGAVALCRARAAKNNIAVHVEVKPDFPPVLADPLRIKQVLIHLLSNAIKFTPDGGDVRIKATLDGGGSLRVAVIDRGIGMAQNCIHDALQPFGQADNHVTKKFDGAGLGLPLARSLIEHHGGRLEIESAPGEGTCATFVLPQWRVRMPGETLTRAAAAL